MTYVSALAESCLHLLTLLHRYAKVAEAGDPTLPLLGLEIRYYPSLRKVPVRVLARALGQHAR